MRILYISTLTEGDTALHRVWALERLGHTVIRLNAAEYRLSRGLLHKVAFRLVMGPHIQRLNRDLLALTEREKVDVLLADKLLELQPGTLRELRKRGVVTASYMIDNAFGPRRDPGWRLYMNDVPEFDLHITQREVSVQDLLARGARNVLKIQTAYEPTLHFPPPPGWSDADRDRGVSFIGSPYDERARFLARLSREAALPVVINGRSVWQERLQVAGAPELWAGGELYRAQYREAIWRSRVNLSFITHSNQDEFAHKSFEIAACGGFLMAEHSAGHAARFIDGEEAVFFSSFEECVARLREYLPDEPARNRIAAAGQARAARSGYSNDAQMSLVVERLQSLVDARPNAAN